MSPCRSWIYALLLFFFGALDLHAGGSVQGGLTLGSTYLWRGLDLNHSTPALLGNLYFQGDRGAYLGLTVATVEFSGGPGTDPQVELTLDTGYAWKRGPLDLKLGIFRGRYANAATFDYVEPYFSLERGRSRLLAAYSPHYFGYQSNSVWFSLGHRLPLTAGMILDLEVGHFQFSNLSQAAMVNYVNTVAGLEKSFAEVTALLQYSHTTPGAVGFPVVRWVFSLAQSF
jgi:uncharacterized protein (TIGR02001 family)